MLFRSETRALHNRFCATGTIFRAPDGVIGIPLSEPSSLVPVADLFHITERHGVCGLVAGVRSLPNIPGKPTVLEMDFPHPNQSLVIAIPEDRASAFGDIEKAYLGRMICAAGTVVKGTGGMLVLTVREKGDLGSLAAALRPGIRQEACGVVSEIRDMPEAKGSPTVLLLSWPPVERTLAVAIPKDKLAGFCDLQAKYLAKRICATGNVLKTERGVVLILTAASDIRLHKIQPAVGER